MKMYKKISILQRLMKSKKMELLIFRPKSTVMKTFLVDHGSSEDIENGETEKKTWHTSMSNY